MMIGVEKKKKKKNEELGHGKALIALEIRKGKPRIGDRKKGIISERERLTKSLIGCIA